MKTKFFDSIFFVANLNFSTYYVKHCCNLFFFKVSHISGFLGCLSQNIHYIGFSRIPGFVATLLLMNKNSTES